MNRIYQNTTLEINGIISLDKAASQHLLHVLRLHIGDELIIFNGTGGEYHAQIIAVSKQQAQIQITFFDSIEREPPLSIHLGQCISRGERMDYAIQKSVEVGVHEITPLFSTRCNVKLDEERLEKRMRHWQQIIISACEQSGRTHIPVLHLPDTLSSWVLQCQGIGFVAAFQETPPSLSHTQFQTANLLIGPEGGLTQDEIQLAYQHQFQSLSLGGLILRTETAPIVAITLLQERLFKYPSCLPHTKTDNLQRS